MKSYDVFVIGSGSAGQNVAITCAENGMSVGITDNRPYGGVCALRGCTPKKVLVGAVDTYHQSKLFAELDILKKPEIRWKQLKKFQDTFTQDIPEDTEDKLKKKGIELHHGSPKFISENQLEINGDTIEAEHIVIATGQVPRTLDFDGAEYLFESQDFFRLKKLPKSMIFIGGGYIAMEFAHMAVLCGVKVTILERGDRILKPFDSDLSEELKDASEALGITFVFDTDIKEVQAAGEKMTIKYTKDQEEHTLDAEMIFNTSGRVPSIDELDLDKGNVAFTDSGISVDEYLQNTTNPNVYACGDVTDSKGLPLTPLSSKESKAVAHNLVSKERKKIRYAPQPSVVFTVYQLASIGMTEEEAEKENIPIEIKHKKISDWYNAKRMNIEHYSYKVILHKETEKILGAHILGPEAGESINLFAMAIANDMDRNDFRDLIFTYPSWASDVQSMV